MFIRLKNVCLLKSSIVKGLVICTLRLLILSLGWCKRAAAPLVCLNQETFSQSIAATESVELHNVNANSQGFIQADTDWLWFSPKRLN